MNQESRKKHEFHTHNVFAIVIIAACFLLPSSVALAVDAPPVDFNAHPADKTSPFGYFSIVKCDGPDLSRLKAPVTITLNDKTVTTVPGQNPAGYVPCDFKGFMMQAQFIINAAIALGVLLAIAGIGYAGALYVTGNKNNVDKAKEMFPKMIKGFIIMLTAWFIVYQILSWLTGNTAYLSGTIQ